MKIGRNLPCWCGSGKKYKACHMAFDEKIARFQHAGHIVPDRKLIKTEKDIEGIKRSAVINVAVLDEIGEKIGDKIDGYQTGPSSSGDRASVS